MKTEMTELLLALVKDVQAKGSVVVTDDGMVVAGELSLDIEQDVIAALSSFLIAATDRCLKQGGMGPMSGLTMIATHGRLVIRSLPDAFLVVITDQFADMDKVKTAIDQVCKKLSKLIAVQA